MTDRQNTKETTAKDFSVFQYLKKRGFKGTESMFIRELTEAQSSFDQFVFDSSLLDSNAPVHSSGPPDSFLNVYTNETSRAIVDSYQSLRRYVEDSLDLYKGELQAVLFPFFVHLFLDLLARDFSNEAFQFRDQYAADFADQFPDDIQQLKSVTDKSHVKNHPFAKHYRQNKYIVLMSSYSFELLVSFLMDSHYVTLLKLLNQYLNIKVYSNKPLQKAQGENTNIGITGKTSQQIMSVNQQEIRTGKAEPEDSFQELVERGIKYEPEFSGQDSVEIYAVFRDNNYPDNAPSKENSIPVPPKTNADVMKEIDQIKDFRHRLRLSARQPPSAVTYTLHNTFNTLTTSKLSWNFKLLAGGFEDSFIKIWSLTGQKLRSLKGTTEFSAHDFENTDNPNSGREAGGHSCKRLVGHSDAVYDLAFSPDDRYLLSASGDGSARLWSMDTFSNLVAYKGHNYPVWSVDFGLEGQYFATGSHDRTARLWSCERAHPLRIFSGHLSDVECVKFHPNSNYLLSSSADKTIRLWDINQGKCVRLFTSSALASTKDTSQKNAQLSSSASMMTTKLDSGHPTYTKSIMSLAISPDGQWAASGGDDGSVIVWEIASARVLRRFNLPQNLDSGKLVGGSPVYSLDFSLDGFCLCAGYADGHLMVWDLKRGHSDEMLKNSTDSFVLSSAQTKRTPIHDARFSPRNLVICAGPFLPYE